MIGKQRDQDDDEHEVREVVAEDGADEQHEREHRDRLQHDRVGVDRALDP